METCPLCDFSAFPGQQIVLENETCYYLQNEKEQNILEGSGIIIPKQHRETVFDLTEREWIDTFGLMQKAKALLDGKYAPGGYTTGWNVNQTGGQTIHHAHFHLIPRFHDEPYAGKGLRAWIKTEENRRPSRLRLP